jgi:hypothetical protein
MGTKFSFRGDSEEDSSEEPQTEELQTVRHFPIGITEAELRAWFDGDRGPSFALKSYQELSEDDLGSVQKEN